MTAVILLQECNNLFYYWNITGSFPFKMAKIITPLVIITLVASECEQGSFIQPASQVCFYLYMYMFKKKKRLGGGL